MKVPTVFSAMPKVMYEGMEVYTVFPEMLNVFEGANGLYGDAQGVCLCQRSSQRYPRFLKVPTVLLLRYRYCSRSQVFLSSEYTSTFFVFRVHQHASCEKMRSCVSAPLFGRRQRPALKCPGFIGGACVLSEPSFFVFRLHQ